MANDSISSRGSTDFLKSISDELQEHRKKSQELGKQIESLRLEKDRIDQIIGHLADILELSNDERTPNNPNTKLAPRPAGYREICDMAARILTERSPEQVHYKDLADEVRRRGIKIGGTDPGVNLITKISRDPRFVRPEKRGYYALRKDYPDAQNVGEKNTAGRAMLDADQGTANETE